MARAIAEPPTLAQKLWRQPAFHIMRIQSELVISQVMSHGQGAHDYDAHTRVVHGCEHYDMSSSDDDENWDQVDGENMTPILGSYMGSSETSPLATFGRGRGRSSKGKGKRGGRKGSAKPWSSLQTDKPAAPWFPTEVEAAFVASVRLKNGVPLLVDTGSPGNLCGDEWSNEMATESTSKVGRTP